MVGLGLRLSKSVTTGRISANDRLFVHAPTTYYDRSPVSQEENEASGAVYRSVLRKMRKGIFFKYGDGNVAQRKKRRKVVPPEVVISKLKKCRKPS